MILITSIIIAFILSGIACVANDFNTSTIHRPLWARSPTVLKGLIIAFFWFLRPISDMRLKLGLNKKAIAFGLLAVFGQMVVMTTMTFSCIKLSFFIFENFYFQLGSTVVCIVVGYFFIVPLLNLLITPLLVLISWPLNLFFRDETRKPDGQNSQTDESGKLSNTDDSGVIVKLEEYSALIKGQDKLEMSLVLDYAMMNLNMTKKDALDYAFKVIVLSKAGNSQEQQESGSIIKLSISVRKFDLMNMVLVNSYIKKLKT